MVNKPLDETRIKDVDLSVIALVKRLRRPLIIDVMPCVVFFQAEDGIRVFHVTGVQTCALPICPEVVEALQERDSGLGTEEGWLYSLQAQTELGAVINVHGSPLTDVQSSPAEPGPDDERMM